MRTIWFEDGKVRLIDQTQLPNRLKIITCSTPVELAGAIKKMRVRGAPAIGIAAAFALAMAHINGQDLLRVAKLLKSTRPTAANLSWAVDRVLSSGDPVKEAKKIEREDLQINARLSEIGSALINGNDTILTHCNAGFLATAGEYGTALGIIKKSHEQGKKIHVYVDETRPRLQGTLTAWELARDKIPFTLICDDAAGFLMQLGKIDKVLVGADKITSKSVINKIGTYSLAVLARKHGIPFYVAAPTSTFKDSETRIEERDPDEVRIINSKPICPPCDVYNPAFDITPLELVTAIITEKGISYPKEK